MNKNKVFLLLILLFAAGEILSEKGCEKIRNKLRYLILLMPLCFLISSCQNQDGLHNYGSVSSDPDHPSQMSIGIEQLQLIDVPSDASIFFVQEDYLLYKRWDESTDNESENGLLYYYRYDTKETHCLGQVRFPNMYANPAIQIGNFLYLLGGLDGRQYGICKVDLDTFKIEQIYEIGINTFFPRLNKFKDQLVLLGISSDNGTTQVYRLEILAPEGGNRKVIAERTFSSESGACIVCIDTDKDYIYAFEEELHAGDWIYRILCFGPDGETDSYSVDLSELIQVSADGFCEDGVIHMEKIGNYFALHTLNGRLYFLSMANGSIQKEPIDDKFYRSIPGGYSFLTDAEPDADSLYILAQNDGTAIYLFNREAADFQEIELPENEKLHFLYGHGSQVVVQKQADTNLYDGPFYLLSLPG